MDFTVKSISKKDIDRFSSILISASQWLKNNNQEMWRIDELTPDILLKKNNISEMFIGYVGDEPAGTIIVQKKDDLFWPENFNDDALYIHKLAVDRKFAGQGVSQLLIDWVKSEAGRLGKDYIRLDCATDRFKLRMLYEAEGFKHIGNRTVTGFHVSLYEYQLSLF